MNMQRARKGVQQGFTLIELMIVVAIIGILAAVAIPQYRDYTTKSRWSANVAAVAGIQQAIAQCLQENAGNIAVCGTMDQLVAAGNLRSNVLPDVPNGAVANGPGAAEFALTGGVISITGGANAGNCVITLTPNRGADPAQSNSLTWEIRSAGTGECTRQTTGFAGP